MAGHTDFDRKLTIAKVSGDIANKFLSPAIYPIAEALRSGMSGAELLAKLGSSYAASAGAGITSLGSAAGSTLGSVFGYLKALDVAAGLLTYGISPATGANPSKTTRALSVVGLGGFGSIFDSPQNEPFKVLSPLALATDQLRRGIPFSDPRVQRRLDNFDRRTAAGARFAQQLEALGIPAGTTAGELLANFDFSQRMKGNAGQIQILPLGTIVSEETRRVLGAPVAALPGAGTTLQAGVGLTPEETRLLRRAQRRSSKAPGLKPIEIPESLLAKLAAQNALPAFAPLQPLFQRNNSTTGGTATMAFSPGSTPTQNGPQGMAAFGSVRSILGPQDAGGTNNMATGIWDQIGSAIEGLGSLANSALPILQATGVIRQPGTQFAPTQFVGGAAGGGVDLAAILAAAGAGAAASGLNFDLPMIDVVGQGAGNVVQPFRVSRLGTQTAQAHVVPKANGGIEWFIPAGKPTAWSRATIKKNRRCRPR